MPSLLLRLSPVKGLGTIVNFTLSGLFLAQEQSVDIDCLVGVFRVGEVGLGFEG